MKKPLSENTQLSKVQLVVYDELNVGKLLNWCSLNNVYYYIMRHEPENEGEKEHWHVALQSVEKSKHVFRLSQIINNCSCDNCTITINLFERLEGIDGFLLYCTHFLEEKVFQYDFSFFLTNDMPTVDIVRRAWENGTIDPNGKKVSYLSNVIELIQNGVLTDIDGVYLYFKEVAGRIPCYQELLYCKNFLNQTYKYVATKKEQ